MTTWPFRTADTAYLDTAASAQKPKPVLDAIQAFYTTSYANVHRGLYPLAVKATEAYEGARKDVAGFLGCTPQEVIFTSGTTDAMNLLATSVPLTKDDVVVLSELDHHSTIIPWQQAAKRAGATVRWIPANQGRFDYGTAARLLREGASVLAVSGLSNVTGELIDLKRLAKWTHDAGGFLFVDGAQHAAHVPVDLEGVDAYAFSSHKVYGPTGVGALYVREDLLARLRPYRFGGEMVDSVGKRDTTFRSGPARFEAGTPPIAQAVGFAAAVRWLASEDREAEQSVVDRLVERLKDLAFVRILADTRHVGLVSFTVKGVHAHDVAEFLGSKGVAVRAGHHCCQVLHDSLNIPASVRASVGLYTTDEEVDRLIAALEECREAFDV